MTSLERLPEGDLLIEPAKAESKTNLRRYKPYPEYKASGVEWLGEIPERWAVKRLRSSARGCQNGVWGDEPDGLNDVPCVRVADFDRITFRVNMSDPTLRSVEAELVEARGLRAGDLLLEKSGGGENQPVGAVVLYDHVTKAVCSNFMARMPVADGYSPRFLTYLHAALYSTRLNVRSIKQSTGIQNLDSASYLSEAAAFPGKEEQRAIAAFLDRETARIDALVAKKQRLIELLEEKRTALITQTVTKGLDPNVPMKDSGVEWLGEIPAHWEATRLKHVFSVVNGSTPHTGVGDFWDGDIPWVTPEDLSEIDTSTIKTTRRRITEAGYRSCGTMLVPAGSLVLSTRAPIGHLAIAGMELCANQGCRCVVFLRTWCNEFFYFQLLAAKSELKSLGQGSTFMELAKGKLEDVVITAPPQQGSNAPSPPSSNGRLPRLMRSPRRSAPRSTVSTSSAQPSSPPQ